MSRLRSKAGTRTAVVAMDRMAILRGAAAHVRLHLVRRAAREDQHGLLQHLDWPGLVYSGLGFALLYAGLDQGNRLDWRNNGLVNGLLISGGLLTLAFVVRELWTAKPFLNLRLSPAKGLSPILLLVAGFRFIILSTAYIIPTYLQVVQNFRELQVGAVLLWIALPQLLIVLPLGWLLQRVDARWVLAFGAILIGIACLMGTSLTRTGPPTIFFPPRSCRRSANPSP